MGINRLRLQSPFPFMVAGGIVMFFALVVFTVYEHSVAPPTTLCGFTWTADGNNPSPNEDRAESVFCRLAANRRRLNAVPLRPFNISRRSRPRRLPASCRSCPGAQ